MVREHRINIRVGASHDLVLAMARALSSTAVEDDVTASTMYRRLLREAMAVRIADCSRTHRGPIGAGACGHCGRPA